MSPEELQNLPIERIRQYQDGLIQWQGRYRVTIILTNFAAAVFLAVLTVPQGGFFSFIVAAIAFYVGCHIIFPIWLHNVSIKILYGIAYLLPFLRKMAPLDSDGRGLFDTESGFTPYQLSDIQTHNGYLFLRLPKPLLFHIGAFCIIVLIPGFLWFLPIHFFPPEDYLQELRSAGNVKFAQTLPYLGFLTGCFHLIYEYLIHPFLYPLYWRTGEYISQQLEIGQKKEAPPAERSGGFQDMGGAEN